MRSTLTALLAGLLAALLVGCGGFEPAGESQSLEPIEIVELRGAAGSVEVAVEIADTSLERRSGLSGRESLPSEAGMLFLNNEDVTFGYHMKDTTIPLSLAFIADSGAILAIVDMEPCAADPCPVYEPPSAYRAGLEVNQGAFERWGIEPGATLVRAE